MVTRCVATPKSIHAPMPESKQHIEETLRDALLDFFSARPEPDIHRFDEGLATREHDWIDTGTAELPATRHLKSVHQDVPLASRNLLYLFARYVPALLWEQS